MTDKPSLKIRLAQFAKEKYPNWINGGELEVFSISLNFKASNGSRRCRELVDEGTLERRINGKSVEYRYKQKEEMKQATNYRCSYCPKTATTFLNSKPVCGSCSARVPQSVPLFS